MKYLLSFLSLAAVAYSAAPAGQPVVFAGKNNFCLLDEVSAFVTVDGCSTTDTGSITWVVQNGGSTTGKGPAGPITFTLGNSNPPQNQCLTINGTTPTNGTVVVASDCVAGAPLQQWNVNGDNTITLAGTNFCVDLTDGNAAFGTKVQIWTCFPGNTNQIWKTAPPPPLFPAPGVTNVIFEIPEPAAHEDGCLTATSNADGAAVILQQCTFDGGQNGQSQNWTLTAGASTTGKGPIGTITTYGGTKCLDLTNGVSTNGNKLQIWSCAAGNTNQRWQVNSDSTVSWAGGNKCIDNTDGKLVNGNPAQIWDCIAGNTNQKWLAGQAF